MSQMMTNYIPTVLVSNEHHSLIGLLDPRAIGKAGLPTGQHAHGPAAGNTH